MKTNRYCAFNVASEIIYMANRQGIPISNMALQKLLYFVQLLHIQEFGFPAFQDNFEAWRQGPVIRDVYNAFRKYITSPINGNDQVLLRYSTTIDVGLRYCVWKVLHRLSEYDDWTLVQISQQTKAWRDAYIPHEYVIMQLNEDNCTFDWKPIP